MMVPFIVQVAVLLPITLGVFFGIGFFMGIQFARKTK